MRVGLLGYGNVGRAFARLLAARAPDLAARRGVDVRLAAVASRRGASARDPALGDVRWTADLLSVATAPDVDVVVELLGGLEPANALIRAALGAGKSVVTANKLLLAKEGSALQALARAQGGRARDRGGGRGRDSDPARAPRELRGRPGRVRRGHPERDVQLHPHGDGGDGPRVRRRPEGRAAARLRGGRPRERRRRGGRGVQARAPRPARVRPRRAGRADRARGDHAPPSVRLPLREKARPHAAAARRRARAPLGPTSSSPCAPTSSRRRRFSRR